MKKIVIMMLCLLLVGCTTKSTTYEGDNTVQQNLVDSIINDELIEFNYQYEDYDESSSVIIDLDQMTVENGGGVTVTTSTVTITKAGTYILRGNLKGNIVVSATKNDFVRLVLDNVSITSSNTSAIFIEKASQCTMTLAKDSINTIHDSSASDDTTSGAIHSKTDLVFDGNGTLDITTTNDKDGINCRDSLYIVSGTYKINSVDDGIIGKDILLIDNGTFDINVVHDGLKATNDTDADMGRLQINNGTFKIVTTGNDATSAKGLKAIRSVLIQNGTFEITSIDDAIHSDGNISILDGVYTMSAGDDAFHADDTLTIAGGTINVTKSYEGIEARVIYMTGGDISVIASDDGVNAASDGGNCMIYISGGSLYIDSGGDGIDANGSIEMTGGYVFVEGPTNSANGALDYDNSFTVNGGTLIAIGSVGMAQTPSTSSDYYILSVTLPSVYTANTKIEIQDANNNTIISETSSQQFQNIIVSSSEFKMGGTYNVLLNGEAYASLTITSDITSSGSAGNMQMPGGGGGNQPQGGFSQFGGQKRR